MNVCTYATFTLNISKSVVVVGTGRPFKLHVPDVVACFDDDPSMQVNLESAHISKCACADTSKATCRNEHSHFPVLGIVVEQIFVVRLLGWIGGEETAAIGIPAPDSGSVSTEQLFQLGI